MRHRAALVVLAAAAAAPAHAAAAVSPAAVAVAPAAAGARNVSLVVSFPTELRCGRLNGGAPATIRLPAAMRIPHAISASNVMIGDESAGGVSVTGRSLVVTPAAPRGMAICESIRDGSIRIRVKAQAGLGNPDAPGRYRVLVARRGETFAGSLRIRS